MKKVIMVSGGFDPPHIGHTRMFTEAAEWGEVVVALNSDVWLTRKKGYVFMPWEERAELIHTFLFLKLSSGKSVVIDINLSTLTRLICSKTALICILELLFTKVAKVF
jgi:cytidyltransferase-like protein